MLFGKKKEENAAPEAPIAPTDQRDLILVPGSLGAERFPPLSQLIFTSISELAVKQCASSEANASILKRSHAICAIECDNSELTRLLELCIAERATRANGLPVLVIFRHVSQLTTLGDWLQETAIAERLQGVRLVVYSDISEAPAMLADRLAPCEGVNFIKMPISPEIENSGFKYFYMFSPELRETVHFMKELAANNIKRIYLLGAPGSGKTCLAYYYFLCRGKGNFVTVNLNSESTGDKASMKSLLCGHVSGALPGAGSREGAISFARDGVCFLDESHGVTGSVMQVLMEVLDSGQYLPFGATAKRQLECAMIFASNRSWETLRSMIHLDEHARLGAMIIKITDLRKRHEDLAAVVAVTLSNFKKNCTSWKPPMGISPEGWALIQACQWRGNNRSLIRVLETAGVQHSSLGSKTDTISAPYIQEGLDLWEPLEHADDGLYTSY